jgi:hypothetical protein
MVDRTENRLLRLLDRRTGQVVECEVILHRAGDQRTLQVALLDGTRVAEATSAVDFEEALSALRTTLEQEDLLLACNRYRVDAFVSSMSRQMTDGLGCYIVEPNRPVDPSLLVDALAPTPPEKVSSRANADGFISRWVASFDTQM